MAYTYLIGWSKLKKYYYGVRFAKKSNPKDLWVNILGFKNTKGL